MNIKKFIRDFAAYKVLVFSINSMVKMVAAQQILLVNL